MTAERTIFLDQTNYTIVMSDEPDTLLAAAAAGRVVLGLSGYSSGGDRCFALPVRYIYETEAGELPDSAYLERIARRSLGLPWTIAESEELLIRELTAKDLPQIPKEPEDTPADAIFRNPDTLRAYIREQYGYYEVGMWAVVRKADRALIGIAGINADFELGYHIFRPFRRKGYACHACRLILSYLSEEYPDQETVTARVSFKNTASIRLLEKLGFYCPIQEAAALASADTLVYNKCIK